MWQLRLHCNLRPPDVTPVVHSFWTAICARAQYKIGQTHFAASCQNCDIAITFSDPNFLKESNNLAIRLFHAVTLTFDP